MSYITAKENIDSLIKSRLELMRSDRLFNGLTFQKVEDIKTALKKVDSPTLFALFLIDFYPSIQLLPPILDTEQRVELSTMLQKAQTLIEASTLK